MRKRVTGCRVLIRIEIVATMEEGKLDPIDAIAGRDEVHRNVTAPEQDNPQRRTQPDSQAPLAPEFNPAQQNSKSHPSVDE